MQSRPAHTHIQMDTPSHVSRVPPFLFSSPSVSFRLLLSVIRHYFSLTLPLSFLIALGHLHFSYLILSVVDILSPYPYPNTPTSTLCPPYRPPLLSPIHVIIKYTNGAGVTYHLEPAGRLFTSWKRAGGNCDGLPRSVSHDRVGETHLITERVRKLRNGGELMFWNLSLVWLSLFMPLFIFSFVIFPSCYSYLDLFFFYHVFLSHILSCTSSSSYFFFIFPVHTIKFMELQFLQVDT